MRSGSRSRPLKRPTPFPTLSQTLAGAGPLLIADGSLRPELVTDRTLGWDEAPEALADNRGKLVFSRRG